MTAEHTNSSRARKQIKILLVLLIVLAAVVFSPILRWKLGELFPRDPARLGYVELIIPRSWLLSHNATKIAAWKPCVTIMCGAPPSSFTVELTELPADSDQVWENAARKILGDNYSQATIVTRIERAPSSLKCVELNSRILDNKVVTSCLVSNLRLTATFIGCDSDKASFYDILATARKR